MSALGVFNPSRLTWARRRRGMTKTRLAAAVGVDLRSVSAYETGEFSPDRERLDRIGRALKFPDGFFFGDDLEQPALDTASFRSLSKMTAGQRDTALGSGAIALLLNEWIESRFTLPEPDDWAHLPIPKDVKLFDRLATAGDQVTRLLDAARDASDVIRAVVGADRARALGPLKRVDGKQVRPDDLKLTVTYWGGGKGRWKARPFTAEELPATDYGEAWGERTGDLFLNDDAYFGNVPELVWNYQLGGYPVLKKWLGYRQADRRDGSPLTNDERQWFRQIVQRIAALLALGPSLDGLYQEAAAAAFTAEELTIAR